MMIVMAILAYVLQGCTRKIVRLKKTVCSEAHRVLSPVERKEKLVVDVAEETGYAQMSSKCELLALSPVQGAFDTRAELGFAMERLGSSQMSFEIRPVEPTMVGRKMVANLVLSEIILTIDIAPSPPGDTRTRLLSNSQSCCADGESMVPVPLRLDRR